MKRLLVCMTLAAMWASTVWAQQPPAATAAQPTGGRGGAGAGNNAGNGFNMERTNEVAGVDIDRFIGFAENSPVHLSHGTLLTHSILRAGDPYHPGASGAVLEYRKDLAVATLLGRNRTPLSTLPDEYFFIVKSGQGTLDDGKMYWDLHEGIALLAPPNVPHRFTNTSDKPLTMIMLAWTSQVASPGTALVVRDTALLPYCEENAHWNNTSKCIFGAADGLFQNERMYIVMLQPRAMSAPHTHAEGTEEIWTKLTPGPEVVLLGSEIRDLGENAAYLVPPTGFTQHGNLNLTQDRVDWWLYVARGAANAGGGGGRGAGPVTAVTGGGGGRGANPNVVRDRAAVEAANVAGKPLPK
jgi:mannose-6-phosphate isomerase-like protein (cupin superfamily)